MPTPLHPAIVHFPVVLAVLLPLLTLVGALLTRDRSAPPRQWIPVAAFALLLPLSAWAAVATGQDQEEVVESVVPEGALHRHEEAAEGFLAASATLAAVVLVGLIPGVAGRLARWASVPAAVAVLALAVRVGGSGGELVYTHGAASAYVALGGGSPSSRAAEPGRGAGEGGRDDDEG